MNGLESVLVDGMIVIHTNTTLPHQRKYAGHLQSGFKKLGFDSEITASPTEKGDIHVVLGPHYAKSHWIGHKTILLDRCLYRGDPDHVSLGWLESDGGRYFKVGTGREPPKIKERRTKGKSIFLADFQGEVETGHDKVRLHPALKQSTIGLLDDLSDCMTATGYQTTALVTAGLEGLNIVCKDKRNVMYYDNWYEILPYADWSWQEIESGEAIEHLFKYD